MKIYKDYEPIPEYPIGNNRADVFLKSLSVAIEAQCSKISFKDFIKRNKEYNKQDIYILWVFNESLLSENISVIFKEAMKMYYGRIYIYKKGRVYPQYFKPVCKWVEANGFGGGYFKWYKRKKELIRGPKVDLLNFFTKENGEHKIMRFYDRFIKNED